MTYEFICPNCGRKENITMPITQYTSDGEREDTTLENVKEN